MIYNRIAICSMLSLLVLLGLSIVTYQGYSTEPERHASVPKEAFWLGGTDGGVFVLINKNVKDPLPIYQGTIFYPQGEIWYQGPLIVEPHDQPNIDLKNRDIFTGWDGEALLLSDGRSLRVKRNGR